MELTEISSTVPMNSARNSLKRWSINFDERNSRVVWTMVLDECMLMLGLGARWGRRLMRPLVQGRVGGWRCAVLVAVWVCRGRERIMEDKRSFDSVWEIERWLVLSIEWKVRHIPWVCHSPLRQQSRF